MQKPEMHCLVAEFMLIDTCNTHYNMISLMHKVDASLYHDSPSENHSNLVLIGHFLNHISPVSLSFVENYTF